VSHAAPDVSHASPQVVPWQLQIAWVPLWEQMPLLLQAGAEVTAS
jgi:hypothetical protein